VLQLKPLSDMKVIVNLLFVLFLLITHSSSSPTSKHRPNTPFSAPKYPEWVQPILDAMVDSVKMDKVLDEARAPDWKPLGLSKQSIKELKEFADKMATTRRRLEKVLRTSPYHMQRLVDMGVTIADGIDRLESDLLYIEKRARDVAGQMKVQMGGEGADSKNSLIEFKREFKLGNYTVFMDYRVRSP